MLLKARQSELRARRRGRNCTLPSTLNSNSLKFLGFLADVAGAQLLERLMQPSQGDVVVLRRALGAVAANNPATYTIHYKTYNSIHGI